jgi:hypothetical protein
MFWLNITIVTICDWSCCGSVSYTFTPATPRSLASVSRSGTAMMSASPFCTASTRAVSLSTFWRITFFRAGAPPQYPSKARKIRRLGSRDARV